ncbi:gp70 [Mycobacterium phage Omega]|uniref:Uncharacterized protein n=1 Tax=Mycobacterium phage Omega TaxID=2907835 RepID=Q854J4_BPMOM|nr:gp70 [Mycobacterium phage Omega]AAN12714.1 hypothetical protein PBI_OMEGA_70 [Mycobacterium phage Omega]
MNDILKEIMTELDKLWNDAVDKADAAHENGAFHVAVGHSRAVHKIHLAQQIVRTAFFKRGYVVSDE